MTLSRRDPLNGTWERRSPSRVNPQRSATRCDASLSGPHVSSSLASPSSANAQRASYRTACVAAPRPRAAGASQYPIAAQP